MNIGNCGTCGFACQTRRTEGVPTLRECRRYPPQVIEEDWQFPLVIVTEWCGEWQHRLDVKQSEGATNR